MKTLIPEPAKIQPSHQGNAFDLLRFVAAFGVLVSHGFALLGHPEPIVYAGKSLGSISVFVFFAISGYLVMTSWNRSKSVTIYLTNRALRIFPGLVVCLLLCAFVLGPIMSSLGAQTYFESPRPFAFVASNLAMFLSHSESGLPGVFENLPFNSTVNGSLWTIRFEIFMYLILLGTVCLKVSTERVFVFYFALCVATWSYGRYLDMTVPGELIWRLGSIGLGSALLNLAPFFLVGAVLSNAPPSRFNSKTAIACASAIAICYEYDFAIVALWLTLPYIVLTLAYKMPAAFNNFGRYGDISYGVYLYAYPVQQTLVHLGVRNWWLHLLSSTAITLVLAALSWKFIESPALRIKHKFVTKKHLIASPIAS